MIQQKRFLVIALMAVSALSGCAHPRVAAMVPVGPGSCRSASVRWYAPDDPHMRARLDSWCLGVGPAVFDNGAGSSAENVALGDITFVSWNVHVGNGDLRAFVRDLRAGLLTNGRPPRHFVLLLQEAVRIGGVPGLASHAEGARQIAARRRDAEDIEVLGRELGLSMVYAPSMRNGNSAGDRPSDRGSAILSTLPLSRPTAIELPFQRQRRVVLLAHVALSPVDELGVGVIHLDALSTPHRLWVVGTPGWRATQAKALESLLPGGTLVLGADLNTWLGSSEPAPRYLRQLFSGTRAIVETSAPHRRVLDYIFFRGAPATAHYRVLSNKYGSDHHSIIGWFNN